MGDEDIEEIDVEVQEDDEQPKFRIDTSFSYVRTRNLFGRPTSHFRAVGPVAVLEKKPDYELRHSFIRREPVSRSSQSAFSQSNQEMVTDKTEYCDVNISSWSKDDFDTESATRMRKKMMKEETLLQNMPSIQRKGERCCIQNAAINIYENYFEPPSWEEPEDYVKIDIRTLNKFKDFCPVPPRPVQCIKFEPFEGMEMAAAYSYLTYGWRDFISDCQCYIWNIENSNEPVMTLEPTVPVSRLDYNEKLPKLILGGLITGQLCYWDIRVSGTPVSFSGLYTTFREPPCGCRWTQSRLGYDCFAASPDGQVIWYDVRNFKEPVEALVLDFLAKTVPCVSNALGISALEYEPVMPTKFMVGLETGSVLVGNRKGKTLQEKFSEPHYAFSCPIRTISRNPSNLKCFLVTGDYQFKIFAEDCKESYIFWSKSNPALTNAGVWSPTKHSVFYIARQDGYFDIWDLLQKVDDPVLREKVSKKPLRCCEVHDLGKHVAIGGDAGTIVLMEVSNHFYAQDKNDRVLISSMLERESKREKLIDARNREVKLQQRQRDVEGSTIVTELPEDRLKRRTREAFIKSLNAYDSKKRGKGGEDEEQNA